MLQIFRGGVYEPTKIVSNFKYTYHLGGGRVYSVIIRFSKNTERN